MASKTALIRYHLELDKVATRNHAFFRTLCFPWENSTFCSPVMLKLSTLLPAPTEKTTSLVSYGHETREARFELHFGPYLGSFWGPNSFKNGCQNDRKREQEQRSQKSSATRAKSCPPEVASHEFPPQGRRKDAARTPQGCYFPASGVPGRE